VIVAVDSAKHLRPFALTYDKRTAHDVKDQKMGIRQQASLRCCLNVCRRADLTDRKSRFPTTEAWLGCNIRAGKERAVATALNYQHHQHNQPTNISSVQHILTSNIEHQQCINTGSEVVDIL
jgi:hypothetical protein